MFVKPEEKAPGEIHEQPYREWLHEARFRLGDRVRYIETITHHEYLGRLATIASELDSYGRYRTVADDGAKWWTPQENIAPA